jgi:DNA-directed RNA polymerase specialized sigma24 family protein
LTTTTERASVAPTNKPSVRFGIDRVAADLVARYGEMIMLDAIEFSVSHEDAEDAYQRSLEVLLTKAPTDDPNQLVPWLRVVVRNEAHQIRRTRKRHDSMRGSPDAVDAIEHDGRTPADTAEAVSRVEMGFEALGRLSRDQMRCLLAHAEGLEYDEIAAATGFSTRKVARCIQHGRAAFARRFDAIAAGSECERMQPLITRVLEADADAAVELRPHIRHCLACRRRLRDRQRAPRQLAVLLPPALVVTGGPPPSLLDRVGEVLTGWTERVATRILGAQHWADAGGPRKAAAVGLVVALVVGGAVSVKRSARPGLPAAAASAQEARGPSGLVEVRGELIGGRVERRRSSRQARRGRRPGGRRASRQIAAQQPAPPAAPAIPPPTQQPASRPVDDGSIELAPGAAP